MGIRMPRGRACLLVMVAACLVINGAQAAGKMKFRTMKGAWIVEFHPSTVVSGVSSFSQAAEMAASSATTSAMATDAANALHAKGINIKEISAYKIFHGAVVRASHSRGPAMLSALQKMPNVKSVTAVRIYDLPKTAKSAPGALFGTDTGTNFVNTKLKDTGKGIKVGIIDTGVDYTHPALGSCFGKGCKVVSGYDFVGDAYNPEDPAPVVKPDNDPKDTCEGHGTHVAGIIAAKNAVSPFGTFNGIAPDVTLGAYRVFGCTGGVGTDIILAAMEAAYDDKCDILNLSLGSVGGTGHDPVAVLAAKLSSLGTMVFAAGGNEGTTDGLFGMSGTGGGPQHTVFSVASVENSMSPLTAYEMKLLPLGLAAGSVVEVSAFFNVDPKPTLLVPTGTGHAMVATAPADACASLTNAAALQGKWAVIQRGSCDFTAKVQAVIDAGAAGAVIVNNVPGLFSPATVEGMPLPVLAVTKDAGATLALLIAQAAAASKDLTVVSIKFKANVFYPNPAAGFASTFSSYGPPADLDLQPTIAGIGGQVYSTFLKHTFETLSGTSMATPYLVGSAALWLSAAMSGKWQDSHLDKHITRSKRFAALSGALINTAKIVPTTAPGFAAASVLHVGAGLVQIDAAIRNTVSVQMTKGGSPNYILIPTKKQQYTVEVPLVNHGNTAVKYKLESVVAPSYSAVDLWWAGPPTAAAYHASVTFSGSTTVTVNPGATKVAKVTFKIPASGGKRYLFSGYITLTPTSSSAKLEDKLAPPPLSIPYLGYSDDWCKLPVLAEPRSVRNADEDAYYKEVVNRFLGCVVTNTTVCNSASFNAQGKPLPLRISLSDIKKGSAFAAFTVATQRATAKGGVAVFVVDTATGKTLGLALRKEDIAQQWGQGGGLPGFPTNLYMVFEWHGQYYSDHGARKVLPTGIYSFVLAVDVAAARADLPHQCPQQRTAVVGSLALTV